MKFIYSSLILVLMAGCGNDLEQELDKDLNTNAQLMYTGSIAVDGCEFFIEIDGTTYKPINEEIIPEELKVPKVNVQVEFEVLADPIAYQCGLLPVVKEYDAIRIITIE